MSATPAAKPSDARRSVRRASSALGTVYDGSATIPCQLVDISDGGAGMRFTGSPTIPQVFILTVPDEKLQRRCGIVWRRGARIGVQFF